MISRAGLRIKLIPSSNVSKQERHLNNSFDYILQFNNQEEGTRKTLIKVPAVRSASTTYRARRAKFWKTKPKASEVLTSYLKQAKFPPWTSYFVKYENIVDDQWGRSHFNWTLKDNHNYHILRTGCYPYIKYHCTKRPYEDLTFDDKFFRFIKVLNLGIPCLAYGIAAKFLLRRPQAHTETVLTQTGTVIIYFLYKEDVGSMY